MHFRASNPYDLYRPSKCERRVALRFRGVPEAEPSDFIKLLFELGIRHEKAHLATLTNVVDLSPLKDAGDHAAQERETLAAIRAGAPAIYQGRFRAEVTLDGEPCDVVGEPDFLVAVSAPGRDGYVIRDSKLARSVGGGDGHHVEIALQLRIYGWLYEQVVGVPPAGLEVHAGTGELIPIAYDGAESVLGFLRELRRMRAAPEDAYEPVGWTKCGGCGYQELCWGEAEASSDVALLTAVSQKRARELHARGIRTIREIPAAIDDPAHRDYFYAVKGKREPRPREFVAGLRRCAESFLDRRDIPIAAPELPDAPNVAVLDLEGLPPYLDELEKIYLWGVKVYGERPTAHLTAQAGFGSDGDREGWLAFLALARRLFEEYGPRLPFVHWGDYERTKLRLYLDRYGDLPLSWGEGSLSSRAQRGIYGLKPEDSSACWPRNDRRAPSPIPMGEGRGEGAPGDGVAARVLANAVDLLAIVKRSVVLPLPSYGLKVIDRHVGFRRMLTEADGAWAIAHYIEAIETWDPAARAAIVGQIVAYNEEDLDATWEVMEWLRVRSPAMESAAHEREQRLRFP